MPKLVAIASMTITFTLGNALANDRIDTLCSAFAGRLIGTKRDYPVRATCSTVAGIESFVNAGIRQSPFRPMIDVVDRTAVQSFDEFLALPQAVTFRQRCKKDFAFQLGEAGSYTCITFGVPFQFFLDPQHHTRKMIITIRSDGSVADMIHAEIRRLLMNAPTAAVDQPNENFTQLVWSAEAERFNQLARPGESYRIENHDFIVEVTNPNLRR